MQAWHLGCACRARFQSGSIQRSGPSLQFRRGSRVAHDYDVKAVPVHPRDCTLDRRPDPCIVIAEGATAQHRQKHGARRPALCIDNRSPECRLVGRLEYQAGQRCPVDSLGACRFPFKASLSIFHAVTNLLASRQVAHRSKCERVLT